MNTTNTSDEFFPEAEELNDQVLQAADEPLMQTEQIAILKRVVPKGEFVAYANTLTEALLEQHSSLEAFVRIRNVVEILDAALAQLKEKAIVDVQDSNCEVFGARVQLKQLARKYEYNDRLVTMLEVKKADVDAQLKARKKFLETITDPIRDENGEQLHPAKFLSGGVTLQVSF